MGGPRRRLALLLEYDGTSYSGSQIQPNGPSIQSELERAIEAMTGQFARAAFAGRTDAGVHALGQVACFETEAAYPCQAFVGGLNARLPRAIVVRMAREVEPTFDPRRHARSRRYRYCILMSGVRSPLFEGRAWRIAQGLDIALMQATARYLVGEHDFAAFAASEASRGSTRREMLSCCLRLRGRGLVFEAEANAFLMHQVRRMVAALVEVGAGRLSPEQFQHHLAEARPGAYERTAPACGLYLVSVDYNPPLFPHERELR